MIKKSVAQNTEVQKSYADEGSDTTMFNSGLLLVAQINSPSYTTLPFENNTKFAA